MSSILSVIIVIVLAAMLIKIVEMVVDLEKTKVENGVKDEDKGIISKLSKKDWANGSFFYFSNRTNI